MKNLDRLKEIDKELVLLSNIGSLMSWDMEVNLPPKAVGNRSEQSALLSSISFSKETSEELKGILNELKDDSSLSRLDKKLVKDSLKNFNKLTKIPVSLVEEKSKLTSQAYSCWLSARKNENFDEFAPLLEKIVDICLKESELIGYEKNPYDVHLDNFEPDMLSEEVDSLFSYLGDEISVITKNLSDKHKDIDDSFLFQNFETDKQKELVNFIVKELGYDFSRGNISSVFHPFCATLGSDDVRITTKYDGEFFNPCFWGAIHECGHALYEQGLPENLKYSKLGQAISLGVHESQSRFFENVIGKSPEFLDKYFPKIKELFPSQFKKVSSAQFQAAINKVKPSFVRIEADEVTYSLHVILRYNLEKQLLNKKIKVKDIPEAWNSEFKKLFGIEVDKPSNGCLQDVHWSHGAFGYFPTYALGNLYYGQFFYEISKTHDLKTLVSKGDFSTILSWLRQNIHQKGSTLTSSELIKEVNGQELKANYFVDYLKNKFNIN